jgi:UPF0489 domain
MNDCNLAAATTTMCSATDTNRNTVTSFLDLPMDAVVKVDWQVCQYYRQDDAIVPSSELVLSQPLRLNVMEMDHHHHHHHHHLRAAAVVVEWNDNEPSSDFALDVCLDYFACANPFLTDLAALHVPTVDDLVQAFPRAILASRLYSDETNETISSLSYQEELQQVYSLWKHWLESYCAAPTTIPDDSDFASEEPKTRNVVRKELLTFYDSHGPSLLDHIEQLLLSDMNGSVRDDAIRLLVQAIPHVSMPHTVHDDDDDDAVSMTSRAVQARLQQFQDALERYWCREEDARKTAGASPFIITVARSAVDGFTPLTVVEDLQAWVLNELHDRFCGCARAPTTTPFVSMSDDDDDDEASCRLRIVHDYGLWAESDLAQQM